LTLDIAPPRGEFYFCLIIDAIKFINSELMGNY